MSRSVSSNRRPDSPASSVIEPSVCPCAVIGTQIEAGLNRGSSQLQLPVSNRHVSAIRGTASSATRSRLAR